MRGTSASHDAGDEVAGETPCMDEAVLMTWRLAGDLLDRDRLRTRKATIEALQMWRKRKLQPPRGWYALKKRPERNRLIWPSALDLQRRVFDCCECFELQQEKEWQAGERAISRELMLLRFHKQILLFGENVYKQLLGMAQIMHDYTNAEFIALYRLIGQNAYEAQDVNLWRGRRALKRSLCARFAGLLSSLQNEDIEMQRFPDPPAGQWADHRANIDGHKLVRKIRNEVLRPWMSRCQLAQALKRTLGNALIKFTLHLVEKRWTLPIAFNCSHAALCTRCLFTACHHLSKKPRFAAHRERRLIPSPYTNMWLPVFTMQFAGGPPGFMSSRGFEPDAEDLAEIYKELATYQKRVEQFSASDLVVIFDEGEPREMPLVAAGRRTFDIPAGTRRVTIGAHDGEGFIVLERAYIEPAMLGGERWEYGVVCEGGQSIELRITPQFDAADAPCGGTLEVTYEELSALQSGSLWRERLWSHLKASLSPTRGWAPVALAILFILVTMALFMLPRLQSSSQEKASRAESADPLKAPSAPGRADSQVGPSGRENTNTAHSSRPAQARIRRPHQPSQVLGEEQVGNGRAALPPADTELRVVVWLTTPPDLTDASYEYAIRARRALAMAFDAKAGGDDAGSTPPDTDVLIELEVALHDNQLTLTTTTSQKGGIRLTPHTITGDKSRIGELAQALTELLRSDLRAIKR